MTADDDGLLTHPRQTGEVEEVSGKPDDDDGFAALAQLESQGVALESPPRFRSGRRRGVRRKLLQFLDDRFLCPYADDLAAQFAAAEEKQSRHATNFKPLLKRRIIVDVHLR